MDIRLGRRARSCAFLDVGGGMALGWGSVGEGATWGGKGQKGVKGGKGWKGSEGVKG